MQSDRDEGKGTRAEREFLSASVAVWLEIDRLDSRPEGYRPTDMDVELRRRERAAWERYRDILGLGEHPGPPSHQPADARDNPNNPSVRDRSEV